MYLYFLAFAAMVVREKKTCSIVRKRFCIVVPAYNEEMGIARTLESLKSAENFGSCKLYVIADNCTDRTAAVARAHGAEVLERFDQINKGKGQALQWAFTKIDLNSYDYLFILDADNVVEPNVFSAISATFESGADAVQTHYIFTGDGVQSPLSVLQHIGSMVENRFFWKGRSAIGMHVLLRGTGMAFTTSLLEKCPWNAFGITEDTEYALSLLQQGFKVRLASATTVETLATSTYRQSGSQKARWAGGTLRLIARYVPLLFIEGITSLRFKLCEMGLTLLLLSRPSMVLAGILSFFLSFFCVSPALKMPLMISSAVASILLIVYMLSGVMFIKMNRAVVKAIFQIPFYGFWLLWIQVISIFSSRKEWVRTQRNTEGTTE